VIISNRFEGLLASFRGVQPKLFNLSLSFVLSVALATFPIHAADRCNALTFQPGESLAARTAPVAVVAGDFNRDGKPDLVAVNSGSDNVSIFLGAGGGKFSAASNVAVGKRPRAVAAGDLNGDGRLDLAVANSQSDNVSLLVGDGQGRFSPARNLAVGAAPVAIAIADFNQDRKPDLAVANSKSNSLTIMTGVSMTGGRGNFGDTLTLKVGVEPYSVVADDLNADGKIDLLTTDSGSAGLSFLEGDGKGTFADPVTYTVGRTPIAAAVADFNSDHKKDLAVANYDADNLAIIFGAENGTLGAARSFRPAMAPLYGAAADFNKDGRADVVIVDGLKAFVEIMLTDERGEHRKSSILHLPGGAEARSVFVVVADFNSDGNQDIAAASNGSGISVLAGDGMGDFGAPDSYPMDGISALAVGDFNGDRKGDLVVAIGKRISVALNDGQGKFAKPVSFSTGGDGVAIAAGDFNADGKTDLATLNPSQIRLSVLLGDGKGSLGEPTSFASERTARAIVAADFNGDGKTDLATANDKQNSVSVFLGDGSGRFPEHKNYSVGSRAFSIVVSDFNADGRLDLATANHHSSNVSVIMGDGRGGFSAPANYQVGLTPTTLLRADFNADGHDDLLTTDYGSFSLSELLGNGQGRFAGASTFAVGKHPFAVAASDLNGDSLSDVIVASDDLNSGDLSIFLNDGKGGFTSLPKIPAGKNPRGIAIADFNRDGRPDLAVADSSSNKVAILINACGGASVKNMKELPAGAWGGQGAVLTVTATGATIEYDCANGTVDEKFELDEDGRFDLRGTHETETGAATRATLVNEAPAVSQKPGANRIQVRYVGQVRGQTLTLTVTRSNTGQNLGTFILTRGAAGRLRKCL
jgi:hypothetical protein